jgi:hypothetical protein
MALAPHSVAKRGMSLCALGFVLATPVLYGSVSRDSHLLVQRDGGTYEFDSQRDLASAVSDRATRLRGCTHSRQGPGSYRPESCPTALVTRALTLCQSTTQLREFDTHAHCQLLD